MSRISCSCPCMYVISYLARLVVIEIIAATILNKIIEGTIFFPKLRNDREWNKNIILIDACRYIYNTLAIIHKLHYLVNRGTCWTILEPIENVMKRCTKQIYWYYPCLRGTISYVIDRCTEWFLIHVFYWRWHLTFHIVILC